MTCFLLECFSLRPSFVVTWGFWVSEPQHVVLSSASQVEYVTPFYPHLSPLVINQYKDCIDDKPLVGLYSLTVLGRLLPCKVQCQHLSCWMPHHWGWGKTVTLDGGQGQVFSKVKSKKIGGIWSHRPSLRKTFWIISHLWAIMVQILLSVLFLCVLHLV